VYLCIPKRSAILADKISKAVPGESIPEKLVE
jgi:hypothetical protein